MRSWRWDSGRRYTPPSPEELYPLYRDLEFKTLLARLPAPKAEATALFALHDVEPIQGHYRSFAASVDPPEFVLLARLLREAASAPRAALALILNVPSRSKSRSQYSSMAVM